MATAKEGDAVAVHYVGRFEDGTVFDSSEGREPLDFTIGEHQVIPGFENAAIGMAPDETKTVTIPAKDAYGMHRDDLTATFSRDEFPPEMELNKGDHLQLRTEEGQPMMVEIVEVTDQQITLDANHPLAGKTLVFEITLVSIQ